MTDTPTNEPAAPLAGHTPGPWCTAEGTSGTHYGKVHILACGSGAMCVARARDRYDDRDGVGPSFEQAEANARLIAAAPALLAERDALRAEVAELREALEDVELRCTQARLASGIGRQTLKRVDFLRGELERIAAAARAALANAERNSKIVYAEIGRET